MEETERLSDNNPIGLTRSEVAELLQLVIDLHDIELKADCMVFPGVSPCISMPESNLTEDTLKAVVFYKDISHIFPFEARIEVLLQSGELYTFSTTEPIRTHINTYKSYETLNLAKPTTAQDVAGNIWDGLEETLSSGKN